MVVLYFVFYKILAEIEIHTKFRTSIWSEEDTYLMPCEFLEVSKENGSYIIKVNALDPDQTISDKFLSNKFLFGHPGKIIGHGTLIKIETSN